MLDIKIRKLNRQLVNNFKDRCLICGEGAQCCLEIHHLYEKKYNISQAVNYVTTKEIKAELKKCICLCANCHKKVHAGLYKV